MWPAKGRTLRTAMFAGACLASATTAVAQPATAAAHSTETAPGLLPALKIILVGDSTTAVLSGWGGAFCSNHVTMWTNCVNLARDGRSSTGYIRKGSWHLARAEMRVPGYRQADRDSAASQSRAARTC